METEKFMVYCRQVDGPSYNHVIVDAPTVDEAAEEGIRQTKLAWGWGALDSDSPGDVICEGVLRVKDCAVLAWDTENGVLPRSIGSGCRKAYAVVHFGIELPRSMTRDELETITMEIPTLLIRIDTGDYTGIRGARVTGYTTHEVDFEPGEEFGDEE